MEQPLVLGLTGYFGTFSHDAAASLVSGGRLLSAIEEERFTRVKRSPGLSPVYSSSDLLSSCSLALKDMEAVCTSWNINEVDSTVFPSNKKNEWTRNFFPSSFFPDSAMVPAVYSIRHHLCHMVAGFCLSGFNSAVCLCIDGQGENESITIGLATMDGIKIVKSYPVRYSIGLLYEAASYFSGLGYDNPGKFMGLASYGDPLNDFPLSFNGKTGEFEQKIIFNSNPATDEVCNRYIDYFSGNFYPYKVGDKAEVLSYIDFAATVQYHVNQIIGDIARYAGSLFPNENNLVFTGGVALNCSANAFLENQRIFDKIFVPPGSNDASTAIGAAFETSRLLSETKKYQPNGDLNAFLGKEYSDDEIQKSLITRNVPYSFLNDKDISEKVAGDLARGKIVAWHSGRSEFGPRALGARSLFGDPRKRDIYIKLNKIKGRELWRPLAPSIIESEYETFFDSKPTALSKYMLTTVNVKKDKAYLVPAITHIDHSSRPQAVDGSGNPGLYNLILNFKQLTSIPMIINTSLNNAGEPMCLSPGDTIDFFIRNNGVDVAVIGNHYITRR